MPKKKSAAQQQETETQEQETEVEETAEETQETEAEEITEGTEIQEQDDAEGAEETDDQQEESEAERASDAGEQPSEQDSEASTLRTQLLQAQGQLAAYRAGVAPGMVEDAVTLAMAEAAKSGDVTEASVTKAMEAVLKRHPEWKLDGDGKKKSGGFKLGADRDNGGSKKPASNTTQNMKRWNRFK